MKASIQMLSISHLAKNFGKKPVIEDFSLAIDVPIFGFLGENGAGKTTIMKMIVGLLAPTSGTILIDGAPSVDERSRGKIGYMPEAPNFYDRMTGREFLEFCGKLGRGKSRKNKQNNAGKYDANLSGKEGTSHYSDYDELLRLAGIYTARDAEIGTYSKGMKQRLGFAQALVNDPQYIFLDEPLDGLDPVGRQEMKEIMRRLVADGKKIFLNTHILYDVEEVCDEVAVVHEGKLLYSGSVKGFCNGKPLEEQFVASIKAEFKAKSETELKTGSKI